MLGNNSQTPSNQRRQNWWPALILLGVMAVVLVGVDADLLIRHRFDLTGGIPFLGAAAVVALMAIVWRIKRHDEQS